VFIHYVMTMTRQADNIDPVHPIFDCGLTSTHVTSRRLTSVEANSERTTLLLNLCGPDRLIRCVWEWKAHRIVSRDSAR